MAPIGFLRQYGIEEAMLAHFILQEVKGQTLTFATRKSHYVTVFIASKSCRLGDFQVVSLRHSMIYG